MENYRIQEVANGFLIRVNEDYERQSCGETHVAHTIEEVGEILKRLFVGALRKRDA